MFVSGDLAAASFKRQLSLMFVMPDCNLRSDFVAAFQYDFVSTITGARLRQVYSVRKLHVALHIYESRDI